MATETIRLDDKRARRPVHFALAPDGAALGELARAIGVTDLRKVRLQGVLTPHGQSDWDLTAEFGATFVQPCIVTLKPVTSRVETKVERLYQSDLPEPQPGQEIEMPEDDRVEPRPSVLDLNELLHEVLVLERPEWPRADGAELPEELGDGGRDNPFAVLASLKDKLPGTDL